MLSKFLNSKIFHHRGLRKKNAPYLCALYENKRKGAKALRRKEFINYLKNLPFLCDFAPLRLCVDTLCSWKSSGKRLLPKFLFLFLTASTLIHAELGYVEPWGKDATLKVLNYIEKTPTAQASLMARVAEEVILFHQNVISPVDGPRSHFRPTSSRYMLLAIRKHGFLQGFCDGMRSAALCGKMMTTGSTARFRSTARSTNLILYLKGEPSILYFDRQFGRENNRIIGWSGWKIKKNYLILIFPRKSLDAVSYVIRELGPGFLENVYKNALFIAMKEMGLNVSVEQPFEILFRNRKIGKYIAVFIVENLIIVELKCCKALAF